MTLYVRTVLCAYTPVSSVCVFKVLSQQSQAWGTHSQDSGWVAIGTDGAGVWASLGVCAAGSMADSDLCLPVQDFDRLLEALQAALAKDPGTGFVFSCLSGQGRTTTAMVVAVLVFWHIQVRAASCVRTGICPGRVGVSPWGPGPWWVDGGRALSGQPWAGPRSGLWTSGEVLPAQQLSSLRASPRWARRSS